MVVEIRTSGKAFATDFAWMRLETEYSFMRVSFELEPYLFSTMNPTMRVQRWWRRKCFATRWTGVRLFACMRSGVSIQQRRSIEHFPTHLTCPWFAFSSSEIRRMLRQWNLCGSSSPWIDRTSVEKEQLTVTSVSLLFNGLGKDEESSRSIMNAADRVEITVIVVLYCSANASLARSSLICRFSPRKSSANHRTEKAMHSPIRERLLSARSFVRSSPRIRHLMIRMLVIRWTFRICKVIYELHSRAKKFVSKKIRKNWWWRQVCYCQMSTIDWTRMKYVRMPSENRKCLYYYFGCSVNVDLNILNLEERLLIVQVDEQSIEWRKLFFLSSLMFRSVRIAEDQCVRVKSTFADLEDYRDEQQCVFTMKIFSQLFSSCFWYLFVGRFSLAQEVKTISLLVLLTKRVKQHRWISDNGEKERERRHLLLCRD